jgi:hypothetical protein
VNLLPKILQNTKKGISPFISVTLLLLLAVSAGAIIYIYVMGTLDENYDTEISSNTVSLDSSTLSDDQLTIYVRNTGNREFKVSKIYVDDVLISNGYSILVDGRDPSNNPIEPNKLGIVTVEKTNAWTYGRDYMIKLVGREGTVLAFNLEASFDSDSGESSPIWVGDGSDGSLHVSSGDQVINSYAYLTGNEIAGDAEISVDDASGFGTDDEILVIQIQNSSSGVAGRYEFKQVSNVIGSEISLSSPLENSYYSGSFDMVDATVCQIVRLPHFTDVTVDNGCSITAPAWNGYIGGLVVFRATGITDIKNGGCVNVSYKGYRGGAVGPSYNRDGFQGESYRGKGIGGSSYGLGKMNNAGGGGSYICGGGGEYSGGATDSDPWSGGGDTYARKGEIYGTNDLSLFFFGSGGGGQWDGQDTYGPPSDSGDGGGIIVVYSDSIISSIDGFCANGETTYGIQRGSYTYGSSGGAGGSIYLIANSIQGDSDFCVAVGGLGNHVPIRDGGDGGDGRIRLDYDSLTGTTNPSHYSGTIT